MSSALAAWLGTQIGFLFAFAIGAVIFVMASLTFDREARREKRIERRATATARLWEEELEVMRRAFQKMPAALPEDLPSGVRLHSDGTVS